MRLFIWRWWIFISDDFPPFLYCTIVFVKINERELIIFHIHTHMYCTWHTYTYTLTDTQTRLGVHVEDRLSSWARAFLFGAWRNIRRCIYDCMSLCCMIKKSVWVHREKDSFDLNGCIVAPGTVGYINSWSLKLLFKLGNIFLNLQLHLQKLIFRMNCLIAHDANMILILNCNWFLIKLTRYRI